ncbi:OmpA family protein [Marinomonas atlantica]|uniref:OmpA family protein n=1 Tax=Marinomonas atlantica TaxID=1806668 RepID=UPI00082F9D7A|nr:OmpA family protein [Marinomonas atlantica]MCO4785538.1 OmpA family protein [Marinomonas atlantica]
MTLTKFSQCTITLVSILLASFSIAGESLYDGKTLPQNLADDDKDGVINVRDFCPETMADAKVDNDGCPSIDTKQKSINLQVLFDTGRYEVKTQYYPEIQQIADFLYSNPGSTVVIEGHTDNVGDPQQNLELSRNRANEIALVLIRQFGIDRNRIRGIGYGETQPVASNQTPEGRLQNRRVIANLHAKQVSQTKRWNIYSVDKMAKDEPALSPALQFSGF